MPTTDDIRWHQMKQLSVALVNSLCGSQVKARMLCATQEHIANQLPDNPGAYSALILQQMRKPHNPTQQRQTALS